MSKLQNDKMDMAIIEAQVPLMAEMSDEQLDNLMGGSAAIDKGIGNWFTVTCECGCTICTSTIYSCTR